MIKIIAEQLDGLGADLRVGIMEQRAQRRQHGGGIAGGELTETPHGVAAGE